MKTELNSELPADVVEAIQANRKIDAIRKLREQRGISLKAAKHAVEAYTGENPRPNMPAMPKTESGVGRLILLVIALGGLYMAYQYFG